MENYPSNSYKSKDQTTSSIDSNATEKKAVGKVVTGGVKTRKRPGSGIIFEQDFSDIKDFIIKERAVPAIKQIVFDFIDRGINTVRDSVHMMIYQNTDYDNYDPYYNYNRSARQRSMQDRYSYSSYTSYNASARPRMNDRPAQSMASAYNYDDIILDTRADAEMVIQGMLEILDEYKAVRVADLYELAGVTNTNYTNNDYGWRDLSSASVDRTKDGYLVRLPKARPLN